LRTIRLVTNCEEDAVNKALSKGLCVAAAATAIAAFGYGTSAQDKKPSAKKPPACNSLKDEAACQARSDCGWVAESKDGKGKVKRKAYCRSNPKK
jgi:hypothetical protein